MDEEVAPGLSADWLNAWLAAVGITVLVPDVRLAWSDDLAPKARFSVPAGRTLAELVAEALPTVDELDDLPISGLPQNTSVELYSQAAAQARARGDESLGMLMTDSCSPGKDGNLPNGAFNVGAPRGETLHMRMRACLLSVQVGASAVESVQRTLAGAGVRQRMNGLGFDYRRIAASVPGEAAKLVDPVVECLCFYGLQLHPVGRDGQWARQRGWAAPPSHRHAFRWPVWSECLDCWAIDALMDVVYPEARYIAADARRSGVLPGRWRRLGVTGLYGSVSFQPAGSNDTTRGYDSERLR